ncbi:radical SAM protein [Bacteroides sp. 224]|uniref:radical SAM protein n=1 Tax=Bacteroides sp. 224 TaxID=2302936 RepID=UPI0013D8B373|nr:radical SAM protein [Bacteroides sp. 224]NDV65927.1 radical SAM protein [Bacteroides sp. 224]
MKEQIDITIKPTMACNMKCKHCFNGDAFVQTEKLNLQTAYLFMEKACQEYKKVKVTFHGGEPTLAGIDFYNNFYTKQRELQQKFGTQINNQIVTNGLLLTNEFIDLLNEHNVLINLSFDGPYNYLLRQQTQKVQEIVFKVRNKGGRFKCFCTLSKSSATHLLDIYNWFKYNHISFKTLPIEKRGYAKNNVDIIMSPEELAENFEQVYRIWLTDKEFDISYSTFEEFANLRRDLQHRKFWFERKIAMNPDGRMYTFGRPNDIHYCIGSPVEVDSLNDCFETEDYKKFLSSLEQMRNNRCPSCESSTVCGGVNINIAYLYVNEPELVDYSCRQSNMLFQRILNVNDEVINDFKSGIYDKYNDYIKEKYAPYKGGSN